jgi:cysteine desulfurase/selenocysteine lyase
MNPEVRSDFPVTSELTYLDTAYDGPYPSSVLAAGKDFVDRRSKGAAGRVADWLDVEDEVRAAIAELINARPTEVAITANTTEGTNIVATSLKLGPGDNVVWDDLGYPSNAVVWLNQERTRGVENRIVKSKGGAVELPDFERVVDSRTKVICVSYVSHRNGYVYDVKGLADLAHSNGAHLLVDGIQAVGAVHVDVKGSGIDFMTCGAYKWLLGPLGLAFFYVREELLQGLDPLFRGFLQVRTWADDAHLYPGELYESARKFETATLHFQGIYELKAALEYINRVGMDRIEAQVLKLSSRAWEGLARIGMHLLTPPETRSGIVTCVADNEGTIARLLADNKIAATVRAKELRISPHFFNTEDEIDHLLAVLHSSA